MGTKDMTIFPALRSSQHERQQFKQILVQHADSQKYESKCGHNSEVLTWGIQEGFSKEIDLAPKRWGDSYDTEEKRRGSF